MLQDKLFDFFTSVTAYGEASRGKKFPLLQNRPDWLWGPPSLQFSGWQGSLLKVKWPGHEADHSPPSNVKVKNEWILYAPPLCLHCVDRDNFTFFFFTPYDHVWQCETEINKLQTANNLRCDLAVTVTCMNKPNNM
jgi:hypothetical protein